MTYRSNLFTASEIKYDQVDRNVRGSVLVNKLVYFGVLGGRAGLLVSSEEIQTEHNRVIGLTFCAPIAHWPSPSQFLVDFSSSSFN